MFNGFKHMAKALPETTGGVIGNQEGKEPNYPFGLSISLDAEDLKNLGLDCDDEDCKVGNYIHLHLLAEVTGIHKTADHVLLNLQATHAKCENESGEDDEEENEMDGAV
jgi:hypothetical protein